MTSTTPNLNWIANYIWGIADEVLRDVYVRGKYRDVILPMTVLRRLDAVLEPTKRAVLDMKESLDAIGVVDQKAALRDAAGQAFYNTSKFTLKDLRARASRSQLKADFEDYLDGFSPSVQDILENFEFRNQIPRLSKADALGSLIEKLTSPDVNLSPDPVMDTDGTVRHPGLDNHGMGTVFEELIRRFNEENNEEAGEHFTPRDAVGLMANLVFMPVADQIESGTYLLYDGACGTGGMLTVAEDVLQQIAKERGKQVSTHLFGQEINAETYAICKADLLLKGEGEAADNIVGGPEHSTLSNDAYPSHEFDFMLSNPPYGKSWKTDLQRMGGKKDMRDPRFVIEHADDPEYSLVTRSSDGQMLFLANKLSKMKQETKLGSRIAEVHNGSSLFTGSAGQGESNIRRWIIENDWLEAIVALPLNMFYNTGIATYVWVITNRKPEHRRGKVQLIDATKWFQPLRKNLGKKNCKLGEEDIERICQTFLDFEETEESKIFDNEAFGYWKVTVERPLRLKVDLSPERCARFSEACRDAGEESLANAVGRVAETLGQQGPHFDFNAFLDVLKADMSGRRAKLTARRRRLLQTALAERDQAAEPVVKRVHRRGTAPDRIRGLFEFRDGSRTRVVEYEPDTARRDTEQIPVKEGDGIEGFLRREVLPYAGDAWYFAKSVKIGYEISFNRYFHKPEPMRTLDEIGDDILAVEREAEGLLLQILGPVGMSVNGLRPYPAYRDSGLNWLGEVPEHWKVRRVANIADMRVSNVDKHVREEEEPIRLCNYVDVYHNDRIRADISFMPATAKKAEIRRFRMAAGDVLLTKDSEDWTDIGVPALVEYATDDLVCGYHLAMLRPSSAFLDPGYLFRALGDPVVARQFRVAAKGVTRYGLSRNAIRSVRIPLPPVWEQDAIVRFLDHVDRPIRRYIRAKERLIELLEERKRALIYEAVTGQIDVRTGQPYPAYKDSGIEWLGKVPEHWERRRLKTLLRVVDRRSSTGEETLLSLRRDHGVVVYSEHFSRPPQGRTLVGYKRLAVGQLVVNRLQANNGLVFCSGVDGLVSPDYSVFDKTAPLHMQYLSDLLRTSAYRSYFRRVSTGLGTGTAGFLRLYDDVFLSTTVFLPPEHEQVSVLDYVAIQATRIEGLIASAERGLQLVAEYRTRLIADVVTGKFDVREAAARPPPSTGFPAETGRRIPQDTLNATPTGSFRVRVSRYRLGRPMTDIVNAARRGEIMSRIKGCDTTPELVVRRIAHGLGFRFRLHRRDLPGSPDMVFPRYRTVVFVHGCFWHRHDGCRYAYRPKSRIQFWTKKFQENVARDARSEKALCDLGWRVLVIWECETKDHAAVRARLLANLSRDGTASGGNNTSESADRRKSASSGNSSPP